MIYFITKDNYSDQKKKMVAKDGFSDNLFVTDYVFELNFIATKEESLQKHTSKTTFCGKNFNCEKSFEIDSFSDEN